MADFSLQDLWWLKPKGPDDPLPALQLGAQIVDRKARRDLETQATADQIQRTSLMREEMLYKQQIQNSLMQGNAALAGAIAGVDDWLDPEQVRRVYEVGTKYPMTVGSKAWAGAEYQQRNAVSAQRHRDEADSRIAERKARADIALLAEERRALLADNTIDLTHWRIREIDERMAINDQKQVLEEKKFELRSMLADSTIDYNDARIAEKQKDIALSERRMLIQEGNMALRAQDLAQKGQRLDARSQASYNNELKNLNDDLTSKLKLTADPEEQNRLRLNSNLKRRAIVDKFYGKPTASPTSPTPAAPAPAIPAMPARKEDLKKGETYMTPRGLAVWDGEKFIGK